eukprot:CAMPEP_0185778346 /NCGR_PEP_ID=MMETSP1174-20130828/92267_1 /TAXON_ID=35687 /ORGANISM="Dictyocha speculum, Strain CCMP1381" /LENGTH=35 /DNA_ID= /DNA_START= /DNA_END= /DNA_ORIENTATION=
MGVTARYDPQRMRQLTPARSQGTVRVDGTGAGSDP